MDSVQAKHYLPATSNRQNIQSFKTNMAHEVANTGIHIKVGAAKVALSLYNEESFSPSHFLMETDCFNGNRDDNQRMVVPIPKQQRVTSKVMLGRTVRLK